MVALAPTMGGMLNVLSVLLFLLNNVRAVKVGNSNSK
jgi:hypothetical protein